MKDLIDLVVSDNTILTHSPSISINGDSLDSLIDKLCIVQDKLNGAKKAFIQSDIGNSRNSRNREHANILVKNADMFLLRISELEIEIQNLLIKISER